MASHGVGACNGADPCLCTAARGARVTLLEAIVYISNRKNRRVTPQAAGKAGLKLTLTCLTASFFCSLFPSPMDDDEEVELNLTGPTLQQPVASQRAVVPLRRQAPSAAPISIAANPPHVTSTRLDVAEAGKKRPRPSDVPMQQQGAAADSACSKPPTKGPAAAPKKRTFPPNQHASHSASAVFPVAPARGTPVEAPSVVLAPPLAAAKASALSSEWALPPPPPASLGVPTSSSDAARGGRAGGGAEPDGKDAAAAVKGSGGAQLLVDTSEDDASAGGDFGALGLDPRIVAKLAAPPGSSAPAAGPAAAAASGKAAGAAPVGGAQAHVSSAAVGGISRGHIRDGFGILRPTRVQRMVVPRALAGRNLLVKSETGSGKTLAFLLPVLQVRSPGVRRKGVASFW
jgi:hypothetical protein